MEGNGDRQLRGFLIKECNIGIGDHSSSFV